MENGKVKIFTEGGSKIGLGHISRCSSLYDEIKSRGIDVELLIYGDLNNISFLQGRNIFSIDWLSEDYLKNYIRDTDYCIVDSYLASEGAYRVISNKSPKALYIDDNARIEYPKGIIVNPSLSIEGLNYPENEEIQYLLGAKYIILRPPFLSGKRNIINKDVKEVLITMGGSDVKNLIPKILSVICRKYPDIKFNVVIGNLFHNIEIIQSVTLNNIELYYNLNAETMKNMMLQSDFAITAAGQTIYELLVTHTPFIPIKVVDNQSNNMKGLKKINPNQVVIEYDKECFIEQLEKEFITMLNFYNRKALINYYLNSVDGLGNKRIVDTLIFDYGR